MLSAPWREFLYLKPAGIWKRSTVLFFSLSDWHSWLYLYIKSNNAYQPLLIRIWKLKLCFVEKQIILQYWKQAWLMLGLRWNSTSVKQRAGYVTLKEMDSFSHMADHTRSSVFWTKNRYFISQLGCWTGHISVPIILYDCPKRKRSMAVDIRKAAFLLTGVQVHWVTSWCIS